MGETSTHVTYSADTSGFSFFAITGARPISSSSGSSGSSGRGSGGGSAYIPAASTFPWLFVDRQAVNVVQLLSPGEPFVFSTSERDVVVTSVALEVNTEVRNAVLVAASLRSRPSSISASPEGTVYRYVGVATDNVNKAFIDGITTTFVVSKEWMSANNAGNSNIALFAYDNASSSWVNAGVRTVNETAESVLFEAETRGSEIFAIVSRGEKAAETPAEPEEPEAPTPPAGDVQEEPAPPVTETAVPDEEPETPAGQAGNRGILSPLSLTVIAIIAIGVAVFGVRKVLQKEKGMIFPPRAETSDFLKIPSAAARRIFPDFLLQRRSLSAQSLQERTPDFPLSAQSQESCLSARLQEGRTSCRR